MLGDMDAGIAEQTVQGTGASRFAQRQIERHRRLAPVADLCVLRRLLYDRLGNDDLVNQIRTNNLTESG